jgi:hypothetical protein
MLRAGTGSARRRRSTESLQLARRLDKSPGLKPELSRLIADAYSDAAGLAAKETGIRIDCFPSDCPYTQKQILDEEFFPEHAE